MGEFLGHGTSINAGTRFALIMSQPNQYALVKQKASVRLVRAWRVDQRQISLHLPASGVIGSTMKRQAQA
jgi:hypothetical protein